ncbi:MAG: nucleoside triphosphate pyrophosphohydrolase family protein [Ilumatobacteraceae bacterium]
MHLNHYQEATKSTAIYNEEVALIYTTLGLVSEAGEVADKVKKAIRDHESVIDDDRIEMIALELGDVMWYVARIADTLGLNLEYVAEKNLEKLSSRRDRDAIKGSGDVR